VRIFYPGSPDIPSYPNPAPKSGGVWPTLRDDQRAAIRTIGRELTDPKRSHSVLVGAGMGSGKTVVMCEVILRMEKMGHPIDRVLIVGVRDSYKQWADAYRDQGGTRKVRRMNNTADGLVNFQGFLDGRPGIFYVGLEFLRAQDWETKTVSYPVDPKILKEFPGLPPMTDPKKVTVQLGTYRKMPGVDLIVSDESHKHSNAKTDNQKTIGTIKARGKVALSGTFFGNKFENAWVTCTWLWGKAVIGTKGNFERDYCDVQPVMSKDGRKQLRSPAGFPLTKITGEKHPGEYVQTLPCYVFIATPIGPPPEPEVLKVDLGPEQTRQYREMETQSLTWIPSVAKLGRLPLVADMDLTQRLRLRTAALGAMTLVPGKDEDDPDSITFDPDCISSTLNAAYDVLHRPSWRGKKALILTHSKPFAIETARRIGKKYPVFLKTGDTTGWDAMKESFMRPVSETGVQYLVAVISAVGTSTDGLQANCSKVLWLSEDENNVNNMQGANRVWRQGVDLEEYESVKIVQTDTIAEGVLHKNNTHRGRTMKSVSGN